MRAYHSALKPSLNISKGLSFVEKNGNKAFVMDISKEFNSYDDCDILYSEPAWLDGYDEFLKRANNNDSSYDSYIDSIINIIQTCDKPIVLVLGKHVIKRFPIANSKIDVKLHGYHTNAYGWNIDLSTYQSATTNYELIRLLANDYNCIGDFNCGYGNSGLIFKQNGKHFVMSDINEFCISYIAEKVI